MNAPALSESRGDLLYTLPRPLALAGCRGLRKLEKVEEGNNKGVASDYLHGFMVCIGVKLRAASGPSIAPAYRTTCATTFDPLIVTGPMEIRELGLRPKATIICQTWYSTSRQGTRRLVKVQGAAPSRRASGPSRRATALPRRVARATALAPPRCLPRHAAAFRTPR